MKTLEQDHPVEALIEQLSAAWRCVLEQPVPAQVGRVLKALDRAHSELATRQASLPSTVAAGVHRREWLEALQSEMQEVEALREDLSQNTGELLALAARQLATTERALGDAPGLQRNSFSITGPAIPELTILLTTLLATFSRWPWLPLAAAALLMIFAGMAGPIPHVDLQFDGRSLRIVRFFFWLPCWSWTVDLATVESVVLAPERLILTSPQGALELGSRRLELERLAAQLSEWCACAARERC